MKISTVVIRFVTRTINNCVAETLLRSIKPTSFSRCYIELETSHPQFLWSVINIQGEHPNTPWIQVVIKSKLTGIFLQNWWLQLHKLLQFHVVWHTLNVPPSCYSANIDAIIPGAARKGFSDTISNLLWDRRSAWMSLSLITDASSFH